MLRTAICFVLVWDVFYVFCPCDFIFRSIYEYMETHLTSNTWSHHGLSLPPPCSHILTRTLTHSTLTQSAGLALPNMLAHTYSVCSAHTYGWSGVRVELFNSCCVLFNPFTGIPEALHLSCSALCPLAGCSPVSQDYRFERQLSSREWEHLRCWLIESTLTDPLSLSLQINAITCVPYHHCPHSWV